MRKSLVCVFHLKFTVSEGTGVEWGTEAECADAVDVAQPQIEPPQEKRRLLWPNKGCSDNTAAWWLLFHHWWINEVELNPFSYDLYAFLCWWNKVLSFKNAGKCFFLIGAVVPSWADHSKSPASGSLYSFPTASLTIFTSSLHPRIIS